MHRSVEVLGLVRVELAVDCLIVEFSVWQSGSEAVDKR